jgi:hypothetical protein
MLGRLRYWVRSALDLMDREVDCLGTASKCQENQQEITSERTQLKLAKQKKQMHEECNALAKQLSARPRKKAELEQYVTLAMLLRCPNVQHPLG